MQCENMLQKKIVTCYLKDALLSVGYESLLKTKFFYAITLKNWSFIKQSIYFIFLEQNLCM